MDLAPAEIPSPKRRVLPAYPPSAAHIATNFLWGSASVQVLAAGRLKPALYPPSQALPAYPFVSWLS